MLDPFSATLVAFAIIKTYRFWLRSKLALRHQMFLVVTMNIALLSVY